jgi:hypothetical protein
MRRDRLVSRIASLLHAVFPPIAVLAVLLWKGTSDLESRVLVEFNSELQYDPARRGLPVFGIIRLLGVPIYDFSMGLGLRLPNFLSNPGAMPWILVSRWFTADELPLLRLFVTLWVVWLVVQSVVGSASSPGSRAVKWVTFAALAAPVGGYGIHIDLLYQAEQYLACAGIIVLCGHPVWMQESQTSSRSANQLSLGLAYLLATLTAGHLDWWPWLIWPLVGLVLTRGHRLIPTLGTTRSLLCLVAPTFNVIVHSADLLAEQWGGARQYTGHGPTSGVPLLEGLLSGNAWEVIGNVVEPFPQFLSQALSLELSGGATWNKWGVLEGSLVLVALITAARSPREVSTRSLRRYLLVVATTSASGLYAGTWLSTVPLLAPGMLSQLQWIVRVPLILLAADLSIRGLEFPRSATRSILRFGAIFALLSAAATSLAFVGVPWRRLDPYLTIQSDSPRVDNLSAVGRVSISGSLDAQFGAPWLAAATGAESITALARSGVPVLQHRGIGRATGVFFDMSSQERFESALLENQPICDDDTLEFLSVGVIVEEVTTEMSCLEEKLFKIAPSPEVANVTRSNRAVVRRRTTRPFHYFWTNQVAPHPPGCALLGPNCLAGPRVVRSGASDVPPLRVETSKNGTRVTYMLQSGAPSGFTWLLVPLAADPQLLVSHSPSSTVLSTANHAGLLVVDMRGVATPGLLEISVVPDWRSWSRAIQPWLVTTALVALSLMSLRMRERERP